MERRILRQLPERSDEVVSAVEQSTRGPSWQVRAELARLTGSLSLEWLDANLEDGA
jgi:hypothetical protein